MVEALGLKGTRINHAMISQEHGRIIVNVGQAKGADVLSLTTLVRDRVLSGFGFEIEAE